MDPFQFSTLPPPPPTPPKPPETPHPLVTLLRKRWFLFLSAGLIVVIVIAISINQIMIALLHSRPEVVVPNLEGHGLMDSLQIVSSNDLSLQQESVEFDDSLPAGTIVRQHPPSGMQVRAGRAIRVVISKGGQVHFVPDVQTKPLAEAQSVLAQDGLQMGSVMEIYSVDVPKGMVVDQSPSSGTVVTRGALIDVQVSKGMPPAGVPLLPNFVGKTSDDVQKWADDAGGAVQIKEDTKAAGAPGTVVKQFPVAGQPLLEGEKVKITIVPLLGAKGPRISYEVPGDVAGEVAIRIMARDSRGESQVYEGHHKAKEKVEVPIGVNSTTRIRIYVNDVLKDERVLEP